MRDSQRMSQATDALKPNTSRPNSYQPLITQQPSLQQRTIDIMEALNLNYQVLKIILKNMQTIPPNVNENKLYTENCLNYEKKMLEQLIILDKWYNESKFTTV